MDLGIANRADRDDHHVEGIEEVPSIDQHVAGDAECDDHGKKHYRKSKPRERVAQPSRQPPPPGPSKPGLVIFPRSRTLLRAASLMPFARASCLMLLPVRIDSFAIFADSSYPITGVSAVASMGLRSTSSGPRSVAWRPSMQRSEKLWTDVARSVMDSRVVTAATGIMTFSRKTFPGAPVTTTTRAFP